MLTVEPAKRQHLRRIRTVEKVEWSLEHFDRNGIEPYLATFARTLRVGDGGPIVAVAGVQIPKVGVAEAWALIDENARSHSFALINALEKLRDQAFVDLGLWRMQAVARVDFEVGKRLLKILGFEFEGVLRSFLRPELDGEMWGRVKA